MSRTASRSSTASRCSSSPEGVIGASRCRPKDPNQLFDKILIANRGEIALRIQRACRELGIKTVAVHSEADADAKYVRLADESVCIGPPPSAQSYLNIPAIIAAAEVTDAEAIHPGYGFLSENADFADRVEKAGFVFIGPRAETIRLMGDKVSAKAAMKKAGVPCVPGSEGALPEDPKEVVRHRARRSAIPVIIKAAGGGGGRGMRVVHTEAALLPAVSLTRSEAQAAFGNPTVYLEKFLENPRHIEIQVLADEYENAVYLGERDCSMQRRHQKIIEEAPAPDILAARADAHRRTLRRGLPQDRLSRRGHLRVPVRGRRVLLHRNEHAHPGRAPGHRNDHRHRPRAGADPRRRRGEAARSASATWCCAGTRSSAASTPRTRTSSRRRREGSRRTIAPGGPGIRVDSHVYQDYFVPPNYDSLIGKVIAYGDTREQAIARMRIALSEMIVEGIKTNIPLHQDLLLDDTFLRGGTSIHYLEQRLAKRKLPAEAIADGRISLRFVTLGFELRLAERRTRPMRCSTAGARRSISTIPAPPPRRKRGMYDEPGKPPLALWAGRHA